MLVGVITDTLIDVTADTGDDGEGTETETFATEAVAVLVLDVVVFPELLLLSYKNDPSLWLTLLL